MTSQFHVLSTDDETGQRHVTVFVPGKLPLSADDSHPNFSAILDGIAAGSDVLGLFDVGDTVAQRFESLTERVSYSNGQVYFDGDRVDNAITGQIVRFLQEDLDDWAPLVNFMENVAANPSEHSREQLYEWLARRDFTIDDEGYIIGYKGVRADYTSVRSGPGIVNGEAVNGNLDNTPGNVIECARSYVDPSSFVGCSTGLHVGTYDYAKGWAQGALLTVRVNPRDVVSVPTDCDAAKVRTCRYEVLDAEAVYIDTAYQARIRDDDEWADDFDEDEDYCDECGGPCQAL